MTDARTPEERARELLGPKGSAARGIWLIEWHRAARQYGHNERDVMLRMSEDDAWRAVLTLRGEWPMAAEKARENLMHRCVAEAMRVEMLRDDRPAVSGAQESTGAIVTRMETQLAAERAHIAALEQQLAAVTGERDALLVMRGEVAAAMEMPWSQTYGVKPIHDRIREALASAPQQQKAEAGDGE